MTRYVLLILVFTGTIAVSYLTETRTGFSRHVTPKNEGSWRRTTVGWEQIGSRRPATPWSLGGIHPITIAAFQLLASVGALVAFERRANRARQADHARQADQADQATTQSRARTRLGIVNAGSGIRTSLVRRA